MSLNTCPQHLEENQRTGRLGFIQAQLMSISSLCFNWEENRIHWWSSLNFKQAEVHWLALEVGNWGGRCHLAYLNLNVQISSFGFDLLVSPSLFFDLVPFAWLQNHASEAEVCICVLKILRTRRFFSFFSVHSSPPRGCNIDLSCLIFRRLKLLFIPVMLVQEGMICPILEKPPCAEETRLKMILANIEKLLQSQ